MCFIYVTNGLLHKTIRLPGCSRAVMMEMSDFRLVKKMSPKVWQTHNIILA